MGTIEKSALWVVIFCVAAFATGCGRKGAPLPPEGEPNVYPRTYPAPDNTPGD